MYYFTVTTSTNIYKTYIATVISDDRGDSYIEVSDKNLGDKVDSIGSIYWYIDKQDILHKAYAYELVEQIDKKVLRIIPGKDDRDILSSISNRNISVDIAVDKASISDRIISKGRVKNDQNYQVGKGKELLLQGYFCSNRKLQFLTKLHLL